MLNEEKTNSLSTAKIKSNRNVSYDTLKPLLTKYLLHEKKIYGLTKYI